MVAFQTISQDDGKIYDWKFDTTEDFLREYYINYEKTLPKAKWNEADELVDYGMVDDRKIHAWDFYWFAYGVNEYYWRNYDKNEKTPMEIVIEFRKQKEVCIFTDEKCKFDTIEEFLIEWWVGSTIDMPDTPGDMINTVYFNGKEIYLGGLIDIMDLVYIVSKFIGYNIKDKNGG